MLTNANTDGLSARPDGEAAQPELPPQASPAPASAHLPATPGPPAGSEPLENPQHERMCEHVTGWGGTGEPVTGTKAYQIVYKAANEATARVNASRLLAREEVKARCAWMRAQLAASIMLDKRAVRAELYAIRKKIIDKTVDTIHKPLALAAARDIERSLGLDKPEIESQTTEREGGQADAAAEIGQRVEAMAAAAARSVVTVTTVNQ